MARTSSRPRFNHDLSVNVHQTESRLPASYLKADIGGSL
jgi:hypothetical protein